MEFRVRDEFFSAFEHRGLTFWGGPVSDVAIAGPWDLVIQLEDAQLFPNMNVPEFLPMFKAEIEKQQNTKVVRIVWPDFGIPKLSQAAWYALANDVEVLFEDVETADIAVCCKMGVGRTGTALAILKALLTNDDVDPVQAIRNLYAQNAVETTSQVEYIEYITGLESKCVGSGARPLYSSAKNDKAITSQTSMFNSTTTAKSIVEDEDKGKNYKLKGWGDVTDDGEDDGLDEWRAWIRSGDSGLPPEEDEQEDKGAGY